MYGKGDCCDATVRLPQPPPLPYFGLSTSGSFILKKTINKPHVMLKFNYLLAILASVLLLGSCSDNDDGNSNAQIVLYDNHFNVGSAVIWQGNPYTIANTVPYIWKDTYTNDNGETVTDEVEGVTVSDKSAQYGNFTLSLYEDGLTYSPELASAKGKGAVVSIQLCSPDVDALAEGVYTYSETKAANTFIAYCSSEYQSQKTIKPAAITEGEVKIAKTGDAYRVELNGKTSFGGSVVANYEGPAEMCKVPQQTSLEYTDVSLAGMLDKMEIEAYYGETLMGTSTELDDGNPGYPDFGTGLAFFSLTSGMPQSASAQKKEQADIALYWDEAQQCFHFESPITMRRHLGHKAEYLFPCHTKYMVAPESFTDADFENLDATTFNYEINGGGVTIPITTTEAFTPRYVFFETGHGVKGVMRIKQYTPQSKGSYDYYGVMTYYFQVGPKLLMDIKCPAIVSNPQIR